jgi:ankyrin repeat protein
LPATFHAAANPASPDDVLRRAASNGDVASVQKLITEGAGVNTQNTHGYTALIEAASKGRPAIVRLLLDTDADPNLQTSFGATALSLASAHHPEIVRMLLAAGADANKSEPLVEAAWSGQHEIVRMLLHAGADVNVQTKHECTPLFAAALNGHREIVRTLLKSGADVHVLCRHGITAMGATYDPRIIYALLKAGDSIRHLNTRLVLDLAAAIPTLAAILLGIAALLSNRRNLQQAGGDPQRRRKLANNRRMYRFYQADTTVFLMAYLSFIFFPRSTTLLATLGGLFIAAIVLMLTNESNKIALPERYSGYPSLLFVGGISGMATTSFMWGVLHFLDW